MNENEKNAGQNPAKSDLQSTNNCDYNSTIKECSQDFSKDISPDSYLTAIQHFENFPKEIAEQKRFFPVAKNKRPLTKDWSNPDKQRYYIVTEGLAGFDITGHGKAGDYLVLDFDHVLDDNGQWINDFAKNTFNWIVQTIPPTFIERSISKHGIHIVLKPCADSFNPITNSSENVLPFVDDYYTLTPEERKAAPKMEIFYKTRGRYFLFTGDIMNCKTQQEIAAGSVVDRFIHNLIADIHYFNSVHSSLQDYEKMMKRSDKGQLFNLSCREPGANLVRQTKDYKYDPEYERARIQKMLETIPCANVTRADWLHVGMDLKDLQHLGFTVDDWDNWSKNDSRYNDGNDEDCFKKWNGFNRGGSIEKAVGHLVNLAKNFGYDDKAFYREYHKITAEDDFKDIAQTDTLSLSLDDVKSLAKYHNTDLGNAERLIECYGKRFLYYIEDFGRWLAYNQTLWTIAPDSSNAPATEFILRMAREIQRNVNPVIATLDAEYKELTESTDTDGNKVILSIEGLRKNNPDKADRAEKINTEKTVLSTMKDAAKQLEKRKYYLPAVETVKALPTIRIRSKRLNTDTMLLNTPTGIVDLATGKLYQHNSKYLFTQCTNAEYRPGYHNELVDQFLHDVLPDEQDLEAFLLYCGYCLTGDVREEKALFLNGRGRNGKGTLTKSLLQALGNGDNGFATTLKIDSILQATYKQDGNAPTPEFAKLQHKRCAISEEIPKGRKLNESLFKQLTGGDPLSVRRLHCDPFDIDPQFKMILSGQHLPELDDSNDIGLRERLLLIEFTQQFIGDKCNPNIKTDMLKPAQQCGLLSLLVEYCLKWQHKGLITSKNMDAFKNEYLQDNDVIGNFIDENCDRDPAQSVNRAEFINRIRHWQGGSVTMTDNAIINAAKLIDGIDYRKTKTGRKIFGIKWKGPVQQF